MRTSKEYTKSSLEAGHFAISFVTKHENMEEPVEIEYIYEKPEEDDLFLQFANVFERFSLPSKEDQSKENKVDNEEKGAAVTIYHDEDKASTQQRVSKKELKTLSRLSVAQLKQKVDRPELVEMHDVTAKDPLLLLHLKSAKNSVPVPKHWCFKRKYLQGKRGYEKPPFVLPDFIRRTGIMEMRQAVQEKDDNKTLKSKMREKIRPKMGKIEIDYQKLHDAFFKWQVKPRLTIHGDLYYEGKEFETRLKEKKPGELSSELRAALGMPTGPNANKCPPPWLIAMQRYGPPPSYPHLRIPGLNCPIPEGCSFGYHAGGWGKPPVDEFGRPLYGDVFGLSQDDGDNLREETVDTTLWGELESEEEEDDQDMEEEDMVDDKVQMIKPPLDKKSEELGGLLTPLGAIPSGIVSVPAGVQTPDLIDLRKRTANIEQEMEMKENPSLFKLLPEKKVEEFGMERMPSAYIYDTSALKKQDNAFMKDPELDRLDVDLQKGEVAANVKRLPQKSSEKAKMLEVIKEKEFKKF